MEAYTAKENEKREQVVLHTPENKLVARYNTVE
jgi:hypothetical protein